MQTREALTRANAVPGVRVVFTRTGPDGVRPGGCNEASVV